MEERKAILISLLMNIENYSTSRNVEEKQLSIDVSDNEDFNNVNIKLAPNNTDGTHTKAQKVVESVESFFYMYSGYPVVATFIKDDNTEFTLNCVDITMLRGSFQQVIIRNENIEQSASIHLVYS